MVPTQDGVLTLVDSTRIAVEAQHGLIAQVIKDVIFSMRPKTTGEAAALSDLTDTAMNTD